jgi:cytochrome c oxidase subunit 1
VLWAIGFIAVLAAGALGNSIVVDAGRDRVLHDTYIVVYHFYYVNGLALVFGFFALWYALFERIAGFGYSRLLGNIHFWLSLAGVGAMLMPRVLIALATGESPADARDMVRLGNFLASIGSSLSAAGILVFLANMAFSALRRRPAR